MATPVTGRRTRPFLTGERLLHTYMPSQPSLSLMELSPSSMQTPWLLPRSHMSSIKNGLCDIPNSCDVTLVQEHLWMTFSTRRPQYHSTATSPSLMDMMLAFALCMMRGGWPIHTIYSVRWPGPDLKCARPLCHCSLPILCPTYISRANQTHSQETRVQSYDASSI